LFLGGAATPSCGNDWIFLFFVDFMIGNAVFEVSVVVEQQR
jgi:hypothetical protein